MANMASRRAAPGGRGAVRVARLAADLEIPILGLVAPTLLFPRGLLPLVGLTIILGLWIARLIAHRRVTVPTPIDLPLLILLVMALQALYPSIDLTLSMPKLYGIVLGAAVYYAVVNGIWTMRGWWIALGGMLVSAMGVAALGLVSTAWISKLSGSGALYARLPRLITSVQSSFGQITGIHPNELGGTLAFLLPVAVGLLLWSVGRRRGDGETGRRGEAVTSPRLPVAAAAAALLTAGPVLLLSMSRSALVGTTVATVLLLGLRWRRVGYLMAAAALVGVVALGVIGPQRTYEWAVQLDKASRTGGSTLASREEVWGRALYMIQDFPFTGIGLNTFPKVLDALYPSFLAGPNANIPHAHDIYLQTTVDLGLAGLMAFLGIWVTVVWQAVLAYRRSEGLMRGAVAGLGAGCTAYLVYGLTDAITLGAKPLVLLWVLVGLIVAAKRLQNDGEMGRRGDVTASPLGRGRPSRARAGEGWWGASIQSALTPTLSQGEREKPPLASSQREREQSSPLPAARRGKGWALLAHHSALRTLLVKIGKTLWALYWTVAILFAGMAYLVVGISISGWTP